MAFYDVLGGIQEKNHYCDRPAAVQRSASSAEEPLHQGGLQHRHFKESTRGVPYSCWRTLPCQRSRGRRDVVSKYTRLV